MSRVNSAYDKIVDVHSTKYSKSVLEEMFRKCGPVTNILHWKGQHDKPHMLVEYDSILSVNSARCLDRPDLQVIRASNNEGLIRKYKELATRTKPTSHTQQPPKGPRLRDRSPSPYPATTTRRTRSRRRLPPRDHRLESRWKNDRYHSSDSEMESRHETLRVKNHVPASIPIPLGKQVEPAAGPKDKPSHQAPHHAVKEGLTVLTQLNTPPKTPPILRIPYAGEIIQLDLNNQLEENPVGIIIMLTAAEASQQLWMIVAAHYNSKQNVESAKKVLEAGIDVSIRLGRTDTKPFWFLLDQINNTHKSSSSSNPLIGIEIPSNKEAGECSDYNPVNETKEQNYRSPTIPLRLSLRPPEGPRNAISPIKKSISPPDIQSQLDKIRDENKTLRSKLASLMDDLSEARIGKRRAEEEAKEERTVRRRLEGDLKHSEDTLRRSKRMEETALEHIKREVESRRKTEALLASNHSGKTSQSPQPPSTQPQPQQDLLHQLKSLLQNVSRLDPTVSNVPCIP